MSSDAAALDAPSLVAPREADLVDGDDVQFEWQPVDGADRYILQVAETARFETVVLEEDVGTHTSVRIADFFPADETTFFWRVLAVENDTAGAAGPVESFIATTAKHVEAEGGVKPAGEKTGVSVQVVRAKPEDAPTEFIAPEARLQREREMGVADEGFATGPILGIAAAIIIVITVAVFVVFAWTNVVKQEARQAAVGDRSDAAERAAVEGQRKISEYGVVDEEEGVYRIPVSRAIDLMVEEQQQ